MGSNAPVRSGPYERIYPISVMGNYTANGKVDVDRFCRDNNMVCTGFRAEGILDGDGDMISLVSVDLTPSGQDDRHHYAVQVFTLWSENIAVKSIYTATTTASQVFILGMNP